MVDIFLFGSALKSKEKPGDVDVIALFRDKNFEKSGDTLYSIKKIGDEVGLDIHIEPIIVDNALGEKVYTSIIHEGFSIKFMKFIRDVLNFKSYVLFTYNLEKKKQSEKVRFSYALYGRKRGGGLLGALKGRVVGRSSILVPVEKQEAIKPFFGEWGVKYKEQRVSIFE